MLTFNEFTSRYGSLLAIGYRKAQAHNHYWLPESQAQWIRDEYDIYQEDPVHYQIGYCRF